MNAKTYRPEGLDAIPEPTLPTKSTRIINKFAIVALLLIAVSLGVFFKWSFQSEDVLVVKNSPFPVRTIREHPTADGVLILTADYCKNQQIDGKIRTSFVSATREIFLPVSDERLPKGCDKQEAPILIPKDIVHDTYKIKFRVTYDLNPLKKGVVVEFESQPVEIEEAQ